MAGTVGIGGEFEAGELVTEFRKRRLPLVAYLAGYSAIIRAFDLPVPLHHEMVAVAPRNTQRKEDGWRIVPFALKPSDDVVSHLVFALKYEGVQLLTLKFVFKYIDCTIIEEAARRRPTSLYIRRICFFYEWLLGRTLDIPDTRAGAYTDAVDTKQQYAGQDPFISKRFKIRDNLPGSAAFCPLVHRTHEIDRLLGLDLPAKARGIVHSAPAELMSRAAAFLLLSDSKASFAIEGERPPKDRLARWGHTIGKAGQVTMSVDELIRLQKELIGDDRFITVGLRSEGGFIGRRDVFDHPDPEHISAPHGDLPNLLHGLIVFETESKETAYDAVLTAASIAFGFVYIHPFEDGNGRIHRFLMHHVLADRRCTPEGIVFPISYVILHDIARYKDVLQRTSSQILPFIKWEATRRGNVQILNDVADYYRYFDATVHAEFLLRCIERAVDVVLPEELAFLRYRDEFHRQATEIIDMGAGTIDLLLKFLQQNDGRLSKRAREREFKALTEAEVAAFEEIYADLSA